MANGNKGSGSSLWTLIVVAAVGWYGWHKLHEPKPIPPQGLQWQGPKLFPTLPTFPKADTNLIGLVNHTSVKTAEYEHNEKIPPEAVIVRAQPGIFQVLMMGRSTVVTPKVVALDLPRLHYSRNLERQTGRTQPGEAESDAMWRILAADPQKFLTTSFDNVTSTIESGEYGSGTAFAVSREGIFLTNAHLLTDPPNLPMLQRSVPEAVMLLGPSLRPVLADLNQKIGPCSNTDGVVLSLLRWYATHCTVQSKFDHLELVLAYDVSLSAKDPMRFLHALNEPAKPITRRCVVLAQGQQMPGKDVAVLQIVMEEGAAQFGLKGLGGAADRFVCLPLGNSDDVLPGAMVQAMGFPASGFDEKSMDRSAEFRVSAMNGQISTTKRMASGWDAFEMTAEINHGDSGGPVLNARGEVIGLNVGAAHAEDARGHTLAVPINLARELLASTGVKITPNPGPLTQKWVEGIRHYFSGHYTQARDAFANVQEMERAYYPLNTSYIPSAMLKGSRAVDNPYVETMLHLAERKAAEMKH